MRQALARRADDARRRFRIAEGVVDAGAVDRVLQGATHHRLLVIGPVGSAPLFWLRPRSVAPRAVRVKDNPGTANGGPAHRLGVTKSLMTDRHAELEAIDFEDLSTKSGHIERVFGRCDLVLDLTTLEHTLCVQDDSGDLPAGVGMPFHSQDGGDAMGSRHLCRGANYPILLCAIKGGNFEIQPAEAGDVRFREANNLRASSRSFGQRSLDLGQALLDRSWDPRRGEGDDHRSIPKISIGRRPVQSSLSPGTTNGLRYSRVRSTSALGFLTKASRSPSSRRSGPSVNLVCFRSTLLSPRCVTVRSTVSSTSSDSLSCFSSSRVSAGEVARPSRHEMLPMWHSAVD